MENLIQGNTYLVRNIKFSSQDLTEITVMLVTETSYKLRWNLNPSLPQTWMTIKEFNKDYSMVENITSIIGKYDVRIDEFKEKITYTPCPICHGSGTVPNDKSSIMASPCPLCHGSKMIPSKIETGK